jgi:hypothetical protein
VSGDLQSLPEPVEIVAGEGERIKDWMLAAHVASLVGCRAGRKKLAVVRLGVC